MSPEAHYTRLMQETLTTHTTSQLVRDLPAPPAAAVRRIASRLEVHVHPKHGSWRAPGRDPPIHRL
jgi:hypothetical protein